MAIIFIVLFIVSNEITYMVAVHQQMGLVRHISAGDLCWLNRIILIIPCIWYCGWIVGIVLFVFSLFAMLHATVGWILDIPVLFAKSLKTAETFAEIECRLLIPVNIVCLLFTILSFFFSKYKAAYYIFNSRKSVLVLVVILILGFISRMIISRSIKE